MPNLINDDVANRQIKPKALCPDCGGPSEWVVEFGTQNKVAAVCKECDDSICEQSANWTEAKYGDVDPVEWD